MKRRIEIRQTATWVKAVRVASVAMMFVGLFWLITSVAIGAGSPMSAAAILFGFFGLMFSRLAGWWVNG